MIYFPTGPRIINYTGKYAHGPAMLVGAAYLDGGYAGKLTDLGGDPLATITVHMHNYEGTLDEGEFFCKHWSENEGIIESLVNEGILERSYRECASGFVIAHSYRFTHAFLALESEQ